MGETGKASTGIAGLDQILSGGLARGRVFLLEGRPGTGKTTIALRFLLDGAARGETCLYITLSETEDELRDGAASHGWELPENLSVFEVVPPESLLDADHQQSCSTRRNWSWARRRRRSSPASRLSGRRWSFSTACPKSDFSPRARFATAARSWH